MVHQDLKVYWPAPAILMGRSTLAARTPPPGLPWRAVLMLGDGAWVRALPQSTRMPTVSYTVFLAAVSRTDLTSGSSLLLGYQPAATYFTGFYENNTHIPRAIIIMPIIRWRSLMFLFFHCAMRSGEVLPKETRSVRIIRGRTKMRL